MLLDDYHQIAIHIKCGPTRALIMFHRNLLKLYTPMTFDSILPPLFGFDYLPHKNIANQSIPLLIHMPT